jgi:hypothetical protein
MGTRLEEIARVRALVDDYRDAAMVAHAARTSLMGIQVPALNADADVPELVVQLKGMILQLRAMTRVIDDENKAMRPLCEHVSRMVELGVL